MNATKARWCWRKDLAEFRGLSERDRSAFLVLLEWFENFRLRHELVADREAAKTFWRADVLREGTVREEWQLDQWSAAIQWYLNWLEACKEAGADHRSVPERVRKAVYSACARRGLAKRTKECYGAWAARYAVFAGEERAVLQVETATRFLTSVVEDEDGAYATQKQALNALAFFFKQVCGVEEPVFGVKLKKTGTRVPVVLSKKETHQLFDEILVAGGSGDAATLECDELNSLVVSRVGTADGGWKVFEAEMIHRSLSVVNSCGDTGRDAQETDCGKTPRLQDCGETPQLQDCGETPRLRGLRRDATATGIAARRHSYRDCGETPQLQGQRRDATATGTAARRHSHRTAARRHSYRDAARRHSHSY